MHKYSRMAFALLAAVLLLSMTAGSAAALRSLSLSGPETKTASARLTFTSVELEVPIVCNVTLTIMQRTAIRKVERTVIGEVLNVAVTGCSGGTARILPRVEGETATRVPWEILYISFSGTLPNITEVKLELMETEFLITSLGLGCLYKGSTQGSVPVTENGRGTRTIETIRSLETSVPLIRQLEGFLRCPRSGVLQGTLRLERTLTIRLI